MLRKDLQQVTEDNISKVLLVFVIKRTILIFPNSLNGTIKPAFAGFMKDDSV